MGSSRGHPPAFADSEEDFLSNGSWNESKRNQDLVRLLSLWRQLLVLQATWPRTQRQKQQALLRTRGQSP